VVAANLGLLWQQLYNRLQWYSGPVAEVLERARSRIRRRTARNDGEAPCREQCVPDDEGDRFLTYRKRNIKKRARNGKRLESRDNDRKWQEERSKKLRKRQRSLTQAQLRNGQVGADRLISRYKDLYDKFIFVGITRVGLSILNEQENQIYVKISQAGLISQNYKQLKIQNINNPKMR
jgi:Mg2+ and Co2+ transporter CorA